MEYNKDMRVITLLGIFVTVKSTFVSWMMSGDAAKLDFIKQAVQTLLSRLRPSAGSQSISDGLSSLCTNVWSGSSLQIYGFLEAFLRYNT